MKVLAINAIDYKSNLQEKTSLKQNNISNGGNSYNLTTPSAYYNKITFNGKEELATKTLPELIEYMETTVQPFIKANKPLYQRAESVCKKINEAVESFEPSIEFKPFELKDAKRFKLDELHKNREKFKDLLLRSKKYYTTQETRDYAEEISAEFEQVPPFLREARNAFYRFKNATTISLKSYTLERMFPELNIKKLKFKETSDNAILSLEHYKRAKDKYNDFNGTRNLGFGPANINLFRQFALEAQEGMELYTKEITVIEQKITDAESLCQNGLFTKEDEKTLETISQKAQELITQNIKKFKTTADKVQLDENQTKQLDDILARQRKLIEDLESRINADEEKYFVGMSEEERHAIELSHYYDGTNPFK